MRKCKRCGEAVGAGSKFCPNCGAALAQGCGSGDGSPPDHQADYGGLGRDIPQLDGAALSIGPDAVAQAGDFIVTGGQIYYLTHSGEFGMGSQLWAMDRNAPDTAAPLLDFGTLGMRLWREQSVARRQEETPSQFSALLHVDGNLFFYAEDLSDQQMHDYVFVLSSRTLYVLPDGLFFARTLSADSKFLYAPDFRGAGGPVVRAASFAEMLKGRVREIAIPPVQDEAGRPLAFRSEAYLDSGALYLSVPGERPRTVALPLDRPGQYRLFADPFVLYQSVFFHQNYVFSRSPVPTDAFILADVNSGKTVFSAKPGSYTALQYDHRIYLRSGRCDLPSRVLDLSTMKLIPLPEYHKVLPEHTPDGETAQVFCAPEGVYQYVYRPSDGVTSLYFLPLDELFQAYAPDPDAEESERVQPFYQYP